MYSRKDEIQEERKPRMLESGHYWLCITVTEYPTARFWGGKIYFGSWYQKIQSMVGGPICMGRTSWQWACVEELLLHHGGQEAERTGNWVWPSKFLLLWPASSRLGPPSSISITSQNSANSWANEAFNAGPMGDISYWNHTTWRLSQGSNDPGDNGRAGLRARGQI
jgi:hypothetical protein